MWRIYTIVAFGVALLVASSSRARAATGYVYLQTEPSGVQVSVITDDGFESVLAQPTPCTATFAVGMYTLRLRKSGYQTQTIAIEVAAGVNKPGKVTLIEKVYAVSVIGNDKWAGTQIIVDGRLALDTQSQLALVPCSLLLTAGRHKLHFVRKGQLDHWQRVVVSDGVSQPLVKLPSAPRRGRSLLARRIELLGHIGAWTKLDTGTTFVFEPNGYLSWKARPPYADGTGTWRRVGNKVTIDVGTEVVTLVYADDELTGAGNWKLRRQR